VEAFEAVAHESDTTIASVNVSRGFHAASVGLAELKAAMESGIREFTIDQLHARWDDDVRTWMHSLLRLWLQRCKARRLELRENGILVELETQDDRGYYGYRFDVFPGR
jgi:hypothetical protein